MRSPPSPPRTRTRAIRSGGLHVSDEAALALARGSDRRGRRRPDRVGGRAARPRRARPPRARPVRGAGAGPAVRSAAEPTCTMTSRGGSRARGSPSGCWRTTPGSRTPCSHASPPTHRCAGSAALRLLDGEAATPVAERLVKVDDRLAGHLLGAGLVARRPGDRLVDLSASDGSRAGTVAQLRERRSATPGSGVPLLTVGADGPELLAAARGGPVLVVHAREATTPAGRRRGPSCARPWPGQRCASSSTTSSRGRLLRRAGQPASPSRGPRRAAVRAAPRRGGLRPRPARARRSRCPSRPSPSAERSGARRHLAWTSRVSPPTSA